MQRNWPELLYVSTLMLERLLGRKLRQPMPWTEHLQQQRILQP
jgi:hypothetical protein